MQVQGKIKLIRDEKSFGDNGFRKREMVVTTNDQYPQMILIEFVQDKCDLLNSFKAEQDVTVSINLQGREWINPKGEAVYFNAIQGWRIEKSDDITPSVDQPKTQAEKEEDDLPF